MERNDPTHTSASAAPSPDKALRVRLSDAGSAVLRSYRAQLCQKEGNFVSLADALDALIKSHPFVTGAGVSP